MRIATRCQLPLLNLCILLAGSILLPLHGASAAVHTVDTDVMSFSPAVMTIQVGDTVTWTNADNGLHNVVADDESFDSGAPSTDSWQFSHTFTTGGSYDYSCETHAAQGMTGTIIVQGVFADGMEAGSADSWTNVAGGLPFCSCYFSGDCANGADFCNWGSLTVEDNCTWRENKPNGVPGAGCDVDYAGVDWTSGICDGICTPSNFGSDLGTEDRTVLLQGIQLWAEALLGPATAGGGPVDPALTAQVLELPFRSENNAWILGRQIGDMLAMAGITNLDRQYCHHESHPGEDPPLVVDISDDTCLQAAGRLAVDVLLAEIASPDSSKGMLDELRTACPNNRWQSLFTQRCAADGNALDCVRRRLAATAEFLSTPRQDSALRLFAK